MANPIWSLSNQKIDNRGTKVNPALTTVTPSNTGGWETLVTYSNGTTFQYRIDEKGNVGYREGESGRQYANLQQYADALAGENSTAFIQNFINRRKSDITEVLKTRTQNTIPSQPAPTTPTGQTPAAAASGPNSTATPEAPATVGGLEQFSPNAFGEKVNFGNLKYPKTINSGQDRISITQFQYKRTGVIQREGDFSALNTLENIVGSVTLPMPNDLSETNSVGWGEDGLSNAAALLMGPAGEAAAGIAGANIGKFTDSVKNAITAFERKALDTRVKQYLTSRAAASLVGKLGINVNPESYITRSTGAAINPNLELLFNGPKLRQFGFQFKMTPRSQDEAIEIRRIIRFFKQGMAPRKSVTPEASFYLGTPNFFKIKFMSGNELKSIGKIKTCALVSFAVNYTPDGFYAAYEDSSANGSQPISVSMQMGFTELTPVFNDEYDNDFTDIGPNVTPKADLLTSSTTDTTSPPDRRQQLINQGLQNVLQRAADPTLP